MSLSCLFYRVNLAKTTFSALKFQKAKAERVACPSGGRKENVLSTSFSLATAISRRRVKMPSSLLRGVMLPLIMRPCRSEGSDEVTVGPFPLVGCAHVERMMDGEHWGDGNAAKLEDIVLCQPRSSANLGIGGPLAQLQLHTCTH